MLDKLSRSHDVISGSYPLKVFVAQLCSVSLFWASKMLISFLLKFNLLYILKSFLTISNIKPSEISTCMFQHFPSLHVILTYYPSIEPLFCTAFLTLLPACFFKDSVHFHHLDTSKTYGRRHIVHITDKKFPKLATEWMPSEIFALLGCYEA